MTRVGTGPGIANGGGGGIGGATEVTQLAIKALLESLEAKDFSTETTLLAVSNLLDSIDGKDFATESTLTAVAAILLSIDGKDFATQTTLAAVAASLVTLNAKNFATEATLVTRATEATLATRASEVTLAAAATLLTSIDAKDFATETTLAAAVALLFSLDGKDFATEVTLAAAAASLASIDAKDFATETTLLTRATEATLGTILARTPALGAALIAASTPVNIASDQVVSVLGPLTDAQLRATPVPVSVTGSGSGLTDAELRAAPVDVLGPLTDAELRATPINVLGPLTDAELRAIPINVLGPLTDVELRASPVAINDAGGSLTVDDGGGSLTIDALQLPAALVGGRLDVVVGAALPAGTNNIGDVDVLSVPAPLSTAGGGTEAAALRVTIASDSTGLVSVDDNGASLTVDSTQLPAALVGGRLDENVGAWLGSTAPTVGQKTMVASLPVVVASDNGLALDATLIGGTQKAIVRGGAKGATAAADMTSTAEGADHQALDIQVYHGGTAVNPTAIRALTASDVVSAELTKWIGSAAPTVGQKAAASSLPVALASDQIIVDRGTLTPGAGATLPVAGQQLNIGRTLRAGRAGHIETADPTLLFLEDCAPILVNTYTWVGANSVMAAVDTPGTSGVLRFNNAAATANNSYTYLQSNRCVPLFDAATIIATFQVSVSGASATGFCEFGFGVPILDYYYVRFIINETTRDVHASVTNTLDGTTTSGVLTSVSALNNVQYHIVIEDNVVRFIIEDNGVFLAEHQMMFSLRNAALISSPGHAVIFARARVTGGAAAVAPVFNLQGVEISSYSASSGKSRAEQLAAVGRNSYVKTDSAGASNLQVAEAAPGGGVPSNTTSLYGGTILCGEYLLTVATSAETLRGVFGYAVVGSQTLHITEVSLPLYTVSTQLGATLAIHDWFLIVNSTTNAPNGATGFRIPLGMFSAAASAVVGTVFNGSHLFHRFTTPLICHPGKYVILAVKFRSSANTGAIRGHYFLNGYYE